MENILFVGIAIVAVVLLITFSLIGNWQSKPELPDNITNKDESSIPQQPNYTGSEDGNVTTIENNNTINGNIPGSRFVDSITKISEEINANLIEADLNEFSYARILVNVDDSNNIEPILTSLSKEDFSVNLISPGLIPQFSGNATAKAIKQLNENPHVLKIYFRQDFEFLLFESVPLINASIVQLLQRNNSNITGSNVTVCIVDTGINYTHQEFGSCNQTNNITTSNCSKIIGGYDIEDNDWNPMDENGHGTTVSGVIGANNLLTGVAPDVKLVVVKVGAAPEEIADGIAWCKNYRTFFTPSIDIISLSVGSPVRYGNACDAADGVVAAANDAANSGAYVPITAPIHQLILIR